jgi:molybdenum cofactor biosynthesis enzyme MoaA
MKNSCPGNRPIHTFDPHYKHPCYSVEIHHQVACVQLMVAQNCNVQFNDCLTDIRYLVSNGMLIKVNIITLKGINDQHIPEVEKKVKELGVSMINIVHFVPASGSAFADYPQTSIEEG